MSFIIMQFYGYHPATGARSYRSGIYLPCLADLDHQVGSDDLYDLWKSVEYK